MDAQCRPRPRAVKEKDVWEESRWGGRLSEWGHDAETGREREGKGRERDRSITFHAETKKFIAQ